MNTCGLLPVFVLVLELALAGDSVVWREFLVAAAVLVAAA